MQIRQATAEDFEAIWPTFSEVASAGETYAYPRDATIDDGQVVGTYYIKTNQQGAVRLWQKLGFEVVGDCPRRSTTPNKAWSMRW